jgi:hypothetical protein
MLQESWKEDMQQLTREAVQQSGGVSEITLDELSQKLVQGGSQKMPDFIQKEVKSQLRRACGFFDTGTTTSVSSMNNKHK